MSRRTRLTAGVSKTALGRIVDHVYFSHIRIRAVQYSSLMFTETVIRNQEFIDLVEEG